MACLAVPSPASWALAHPRLPVTYGRWPPFRGRLARGGGGTPGESVAARYVAPGAAAGVSYASVAERLSEIDRLLSEWRERASSQTPAAALFARLLKARHDLAASECAGHVAAAALDDLASTINIAWGDSLRQAQREFQTAGLDLDANPILQRVLDTTRRALGGM